MKVLHRLFIMFFWEKLTHQVTWKRQQNFFYQMLSEVGNFELKSNSFLPGGTQIQLFRGYGMSLNGEKKFIKRDTLKKFEGN